MRWCFLLLRFRIDNRLPLDIYSLPFCLFGFLLFRLAVFLLCPIDFPLLLFDLADSLFERHNFCFVDEGTCPTRRRQTIGWGRPRVAA
jgi:hypothetical protein